MKIPDDPFVQELLPEFIDTWMDDLQNNMPKYLESKNSTELYRLAHTLKGSCLQFGLDEIAAKGIELMEYAKNEDWSKANEIANSLLGLFKNAKDFLIEKGLYEIE